MLNPGNVDQRHQRRRVLHGRRVQQVHRHRAHRGVPARRQRGPGRHAGPALATGISGRPSTRFRSSRAFRRVEPRNTPTMQAAAFNFDNFWDGRARHDFNGGSVFGAVRPADPRLRQQRHRADLTPTRQIIRFASLASLATGPGLSEFEMSFAGPQLGQDRQEAAPGRRDAPGQPVGGPHRQRARPLLQPGRFGSAPDCRPRTALRGRRAAGKPGLCISYPGLIRQAFYPAALGEHEPASQRLLHRRNAPAGVERPDRQQVLIAQPNGAADPCRLRPVRRVRPHARRRSRPLRPTPTSSPRWKRTSASSGGCRSSSGCRSWSRTTLRSTSSWTSIRMRSRPWASRASRGSSGPAQLHQARRPQSRRLRTTRTLLHRGRELQAGPRRPCPHQPHGRGRRRRHAGAGRRNPSARTTPIPCSGWTSSSPPTCRSRIPTSGPAGAASAIAIPTLTDHTMPFTSKINLMDFVAEFVHSGSRADRRAAGQSSG